MPTRFEITRMLLASSLCLLCLASTALWAPGAAGTPPATAAPGSPTPSSSPAAPTQSGEAMPPDPGVDIGRSAPADPAAPEAPLDLAPDAALDPAEPTPLDVNLAEHQAMLRGELQQPPGVELAQAAPTPAQQRSALRDELASLAAREAEQLAQLEARAADADDPAEALAIQQQVEALKRDGELQLMALHARFARAAGRTQQADRIEQTADAIQDPTPAQAQPQSRQLPPAPPALERSPS